MSKLYLYFILCFLLDVCVGQIVQVGQCDNNIALYSNLSLEAFEGTWHELLTTDNPNQRNDCSSFLFTENNNGTFDVQYRKVNSNFVQYFNGTLTLQVNATTNTSREFTLEIPFFDAPIDFLITFNDEILSSFLVAYSCQNIDNQRRSMRFWVLGRNRTPLSFTMEHMINLHLIDMFGVELSALSTVNQSDLSCFVLPIIPPGEPIIIPGTCNNDIPVQQSFNPILFQGRWNQIKSYFTESSSGSCVQAEYNLDGGVVDVLNSQVIDQTLQTIKGNATIISNDDSARLRVLLDVGGVIIEQELWILATDYTNYAVSYSCEDLTNNQRRIYSWILSRERTFNATVETEVNNLIDSILELNHIYYLHTDQSLEGCFYFPEPNGQPVTFRGQCEMNNASAMTGFDAVAYMGLWHTIEQYPSLFQGGACSNARYSLSGEQVNVINSQVINQTLDTLVGIAVPASDDGTAKLLVTFPGITNQQSNYWVLDTNYTSYALVYSCSNLDEENMRVYSWQLSRSRTLTAEDRLAMDRVINTTNVLDRQYYEAENQTEEACFFVPTPQQGVPVVFPGRCDPSLGMENFNLTLFAGTWFEIQAYPKIEQPGQCISHQYSNYSTSELSFVSLSVDDNFLVQSEGRLISANGTGRLTINITSGLEPIEIPFWIIDTDYDNYALAYACVDQPEDLRAVWSWKLSRTRELSPTSETAINTAMADIDVLDNIYFWDIDHSSETCYTLPVIPSGQPIILPGQCDPNIMRVQNFNPLLFGGTWHQIASYFSESSTGTCVRAEYNLNGGVVDVLNSQVINQTLLTITGNASIISSDGSAHLGVILNIPPNQYVQQELWILETDYVNFAVSYSCENLPNNQRRIFSWILSRQRELNSEAQMNVSKVIDSLLELNNAYFLTTDQSSEGCFYFPEVNPNAPVRFRGKCDETIQAVPNFNPVLYMGLWHDIRSYPEDFQIGTCQNANYELVGGVVDVLNTQVINQTLDTMTGTAVLVSTDGSARLSVTFNVGGINVTTNYWVLATNYTSYALVYSCRQVTDDYYQVSSWQLSRTRELTNESVAAINAVMDTIPVLDERYFLDRLQSPEDCFYFPEPEPNTPVIFRGQCDDNILAISNFNDTQFAGLWHEIEKYPYGPNDACIDHRFELGSLSTFNHDSFHVLNQSLLLVNNSTMNLTSTDGTGRLTINIIVDGTVQTIPFWILDTDYNNYALAYGCRDLGNDYRQIYSWKLSRTRQLNNQSIAAINASMSDIDVLDNRYFDVIQQTDEACFYLPDIGPNEPVTFIGQCDPNIPVVTNFNATAYLGTWRLIETYFAEFQTGTCARAEYSLGNNSVLVENTQVVNQTLDSIIGSAVPAGNDGLGKLLVTFPNSPTPSEYWILGTDYTSYALVYSCLNIGNDRRRVWSWKLSRTNDLTAEANGNITQIINSIDVLNNQFYNVMDRSEEGCFYFPEVNPDTPVRFRGTCNESIPAVSNFDAVQYMGLWHDIRSYPENFQTGTCQNANYELVDGVVDVLNTQVINQTLDTMTGIAVIASNDGSARLNVTFNVGGINVTTNYWVLATNYSSYALVYSCRQVEEEYYQVTSWQLSRTRELTNESVAAINAVMDTIPVLDERYFLDRLQSPEDCFYFPEPEPNTPVIFRGQCDDNILAIPNFNDTQFAGLWHEIEKYPYGPNDICIDHRIALGSPSTFNHNSFHVLNQTLLLVNNSTMNLTSTDGTGRLTIDILVNGTVQTIPFWILDTDYENYALAYGCRDLGNDYRQIYSWKLSRTRQLTNQSAAAINASMSNIDVLDNRYFDTIQQTDDACFYLPDIGPNEPVTFIGQCDPNIPVVTNFNATAYLGTWRLIETYFAEFQTGTCARAEYSLGNNSVLVENTQVVNQTLDSIIGSAVLAGDDGLGKLLVTFPNSPSPSEYWILGTDYTSYALVYSCENISNDRRRVFSWKLSRSNELTVEANANISQIINSIDVLNNQYYNNMDRSEIDCFYFPDANPDTPVRFRGTCNESIPAVPNFDPVQYMGLWHDIRSYPENFQTGTCQNANYELVDGVVDVLNTQVINQTLDTMTGIAVIASDDGSARLNVTFNVGGINVTTNYWVLSTNYTSYALVYSCRQVAEEYYQVTSWQLSRTRELTNESVAAINAVMDTIPVLDERYFLDRLQSPEDCFYFPEPEPNTPVIFRGQCNDSISAISNFNDTQFSGLWHEIAKYPYGPKDSCIDHRFELGSSSTFNHNSFHVLNQALLLVNNSTMNLTSVDGTGRLTIDIVVNGTVQTIPFWILDTDYSNYALAYGCRDLGNDYRQIYSWKLSRTRQLANQSAAAIDASMNDIDVLDNRYFDTIQQTDDACFYLPDIGPNEPVTFIGQCDPNIPVVTNFNVTMYLGTWRLIETYFADFQVGTCNTAHYSEGNNNVLVVNTQIVDQRLDTVTGTAVPAGTGGLGKLLVTFPSSPTPSDYWILGTDYTSYALVYSCMNIGNDRRRVWSWKLSRTTSLTPNAAAVINNIVNSIDVLNETFYQTVDNSDDGCFFFPAPDRNTPVVFPGQCDTNITAMPNFDAARYLNIWYDIESYPAPFQTGTCSRANYTLNADGSVRVENTQVVDQLLETWIGTAVVASEDGSAKLNVTFNVNGIDVTTSLLVLDTDYDSYALAYSCENITPNSRAVFSWKLSRNTTLTANATQAIDNIINSIQVLQQKYFVPRGHTEDDCFFYPDNNGGDVILNGQCVEHNLVPAVTNFSAELFTGRWFEVSRFPSDVQQGECFTTKYSLNGTNELSVARSFVFNERQINSTTGATVSPDGRGIISANTSGVPFSDVYILGIDYEDFALTYSCRNLEGNQKQIFSWILSRSPDGISAAAQNITSQLIRDNIDLWEGYYEPTGQDNDACFFYPPLDELPGFVELRGPCPTNIRGVPNFNAEAYLGRWFETSRFPVQDQVGQCNRAEYSFDAASNTVPVFNSEVLNQTLLTQFGYAVIASTDGTGELLVNFDVGGISFTANYFVLATDYNSFSLVYSCTNTTGGWRRVSSWQLSRYRTLSSDAAAAMVPVINATQGLLEKYYQPTSQSDEDCFYIPNNYTDRAPRFRGQCENITGVANFNVSSYLGWWHEIERYPVDDPDVGQCRSSEYRQDGGSYVVVDSWVRNNEGFTRPGTVTATPEGKLIRTMANGKTQDIWVLATDYESYSLLYACEQEDDEYRLVWSAKHSKSRSLSPEAQNIMAPIIGNNSVLFPQFYQEVNQTDDTCFHYPIIPEGQPIIIPGQCDPNAPVIRDLNIDDFSGTWYTMARYDAINGSTCVGSTYTVDQDSGTIHVLSFEVRDGQLMTTEGEATVTEGTGLIQVTMPTADGDNTTTSLYIMNTDYTDYAVAFNCVNVDNFRRQIRAWSLSRERIFSAQGAAMVQTLIQERQELHLPYLRAIFQNNDCPDPSSAVLFKSSLIVLLICAMFQWIL